MLFACGITGQLSMVELNSELSDLYTAITRCFSLGSIGPEQRGMEIAC